MSWRQLLLALSLSPAVQPLPSLTLAHQAGAVAGILQGHSHCLLLQACSAGGSQAGQAGPAVTHGNACAAAQRSACRRADTWGQLALERPPMSLKRLKPPMGFRGSAGGGRRQAAGQGPCSQLLSRVGGTSPAAGPGMRVRCSFTHDRTQSRLPAPQHQCCGSCGRRVQGRAWGSQRVGWRRVGQWQGWPQASGKCERALTLCPCPHHWPQRMVAREGQQRA